MMAPAARWQRLYLVGFMAVGKTTIGRQLARQLRWTFVDLDREITAAEGMTVSDIFSRYGEARFRELESKHLAETFRQEEVVVATGGGAYTGQSAVDEVRQYGISLWLDLPFSDIATRLERSAQVRPLAKSREETRQLYGRRLPFYRQADLRIPLALSDSPSLVARRIAARVVREGRADDPVSEEVPVVRKVPKSCDC